MSFSHKSNLIISICNSGWAALVGIMMVPFYMAHLGAEGYGIIGFYSSLQIALGFLDMGIAPALNREIAKNIKNPDEVSALMYTSERLYWIVGFLILCMIVIFSGYIANKWQLKGVSEIDDLRTVIALLGLAISARWSIGLYQSALNGAERQGEAAIMNIVAVSAVNFGFVALALFEKSDIYTFFIWQFVVSLIYLFAIRKAVWKLFRSGSIAKFDITSVKNVSSFAGGVAILAIMGAIYSQMDKLLLSQMVTLQEYGFYIIGSTLVSGIALLTIPIYTWLSPKFISILAASESNYINKYYHKCLTFVTSILAPFSMCLSIVPGEIVYLWTGSDEAAKILAPIIPMLAIGTALNGVMHVPHALQLARGAVRYPIIINCSLLVAVGPALYIGTQKYGVLGGAMAWMFLNVLYAILSTWITSKYIIGDRVFESVRAMLLPLIVVFVTSVILIEVLPYINSTASRLFVVGIVSGFLLITLMMKCMKLNVFHIKCNA